MLGGERFEVLIPADRIQNRIAELGSEITRDYRGKELVIVSVLKGAVMFTADLARAVDLPLTMEFLGLSSYGDSTESSGVVRITQDLANPILGMDVLIVEDIVDTGLTLDFLMQNLRLRGPHSVKVCTLLHKPSNTRKKVSLDYVGFTIEDVFVVGYGLDYEQRYRNLPYIARLRSNA